MTAQELKNYLRTKLVAKRTILQEYDALDAIIDFVSKALTTGIPDWTNILNFNTDGTGAGKFTLRADTEGKLRYWKTKINANVGNEPPTNPEIDEDANWIEVSPGDGAAIPEWAPKIFGAGLVIVYYDITGTDPSLYKLTVADRPFDSTDFVAELALGYWKKMTSDVGDVLDVLLAGLSTASTADVTAADSILTAIGKLQANKQRTFFKDGSQAMEGDIDLNNFKLKQLSPATANGEAVNFEQMNAALDGLKPKDDCRVATTEEIVLNDVQTVDDVVLVATNRVLVKDQADATQNGIWIVVAGGAWTRAVDSDSDIELQGAFVQVSEGADNANTAWVQYSIDIDLGVTDLLWRQISSATPDATAGTKGKIKLAGDLGGTADAPTVPGLADKEDIANKGVADGYAALDGDGKVPLDQLPELGADDAIDINFTPAGNIAATNVQAAIEELDSKKAAGPAAASDGAVVLYDGISGKILKDSTKVLTTVGGNILSLANPGAVRYLRLNADNTVSSRTAAEFLADIGAQASIGYTPENAANKDTDPTFAANSDVKYPSQKAVKTAVAFKEDVANKDTDVTLAANSDTKYPSQKAVKTHVATEIASAATIANAGAKLYLFNSY